MRRRCWSTPRASGKRRTASGSVHPFLYEAFLRAGLRGPSLRASIVA